MRPFDHQAPASNTVRVNTASAPPPLRAAPEQGARNGDGGGSVRISELEGVLHQTRLRWIEHQETGRIFAAVSLGRVRRPSAHSLAAPHRASVPTQIVRSVITTAIREAKADVLRLWVGLVLDRHRLELWNRHEADVIVVEEYEKLLEQQQFQMAERHAANLKEDLAAQANSKQQ